MSTTDEVATFAVNLEDQISSPAERAAGSLERLKSQIDADKKALSGMQGAMRTLKGASVPNVAAMQQLSDRIEAQKATIASVTTEYVQLGGTFKEVAKAADTARSGLGDLLGASKKMPGPLGGMVGKLEALKGLLSGGGLIAMGTMAVAAAMVALAAAAVAGAAALLRYGIASSDARRAEQLHVEGMMTVRRWHGIAAGSAADFMQSVDRVSASTTLARSAVSSYGEQLYRAGLRGGTLTKALEAVTMASAVQGDAPAQRIAGMAIAAARSGRSVEALADKIKSRLGGIAARQMLSLDVQSRKLQESLQFLTGGLKIEGFLRALGEVTQMLSANTASGRALKVIFESLFNPILGALDGAGPLAKRFFQGMVIAALELTIVVLKVGRYLKETFGTDIALNAGMLVVSMFAGALVVTAAAAGLLALALGAVVVAGLLIMAPFLLAGAAVAYLMTKAWDFGAWLATQDWSSIGTSLVDGLIAGLVASRARVLGAVGQLALDAKTAMVDALGIHSPSRVFANLGVQIPRGLAAGVEAGTPAAQGAVDGLVRVPSASAAGGAAGRSGGDTRSVSIGEIHIHATTNDPRELAESFRDQVVRLLEGVAIEMGAPA